MRFAAELVAHAAQRMNPLGEREISLRGYKIAAIENTGTLKDGYDCVDLSDNEIKTLGNFAPSPRLGTLFLNNNRVSRACAENPVTRCAHYRSYLVAKIPTLKVLDFKKVKPQERVDAKKLFPEGQPPTVDLRAMAPKPPPRVPGGAPPPPPGRPAGLGNLTDDQKAAIRAAVAAASTPEEVDELERQLRAGIIGRRRAADAAGPPAPPGAAGRAAAAALPAAAPPPPAPPAPPAARPANGHADDDAMDTSDAPPPAAPEPEPEPAPAPEPEPEPEPAAPPAPEPAPEPEPEPMEEEAADGLTKEEVEKMKVAELWAARETDLSTKGLKAVLKKRLLEAL
ncbi:U2 snRNA binding protein [Aureococcus anophagefferens]|nr:U2 snRNA binding protein [Aureococcus anophagefferens]